MIKWFTRNKQKYIDLGYKFTKLSDLFCVSVKDLDKNSGTKVEVFCDCCGKSIMTPYRNYNKIVEKSGEYRCRKCNAPYVSEIRINNYAKFALEKFNRMVTNIGCTPLAHIEDYNGYDTPMLFLCPKHGEQKLSIDQLNQGCICPECGKENKANYSRLSKDSVSDIVAFKNGNHLLNPQDYINYSKKNLIIKCGSCGDIFVSSLSSLESGNGRCKKCALKALSMSLRASQDEIISDSTQNGICYLTNPQDYVSATKKNLKFRCSSCGKIFVQSMSHYKRGDTRCAKCISRVSVGENRIMNVLDNYNVTYICQKKFDDCKDKRCLPFDIYLPDYNYCIEFDGMQHYRMLSYDTIESFKKRKLHDSMKTKYCEENGIHLIRIPYLEYKNIEYILKKELNLDENVI